MASSTSLVDLLGLSIRQFVKVYIATGSVIHRRNEAIKNH